VALIIRPFRHDDEAAALAAEASFDTPGFSFLIWHEPQESWAHYVEHMHAMEAGVIAEGRVRAANWVAEVDGELVGTVSVRFGLNDFLAHRGGHIGYAVHPTHRRRGYATQILRLAVDLARREGVTDVLVTCNDDNEASAGVIEACGGELESVKIDDDGVAFRRYWIRPQV
jgi:predicted acetyltransferase